MRVFVREPSPRIVRNNLTVARPELSASEIRYINQLWTTGTTLLCKFPSSERDVWITGMFLRYPLEGPRLSLIQTLLRRPSFLLLRPSTATHSRPDHLMGP